VIWLWRGFLGLEPIAMLVAKKQRMIGDCPVLTSGGPYCAGTQNKLNRISNGGVLSGMDPRRAFMLIELLMSTAIRCLQPVAARAGRQGGFACGVAWLLLSQAVGVWQLSAQITLEAEQGRRLNEANVQGAAQASGGAIVGFLGGDKNGTVVFENVSVSRGGRYILAVRYATADPRSLNITVNEKQKVSIQCPASKGWFEFKVKNAEVTLKAGKNTIALDNDRDWAPNIDNITLNPKPFWRYWEIWLCLGIVCLSGTWLLVFLVLSRQRRITGP
jgi:hypothetical protein